MVTVQSDADLEVRASDGADAALRSDVKSLGALLGEVLSEQEGPAFLALVEEVRQFAIAARSQPVNERAGEPTSDNPVVNLDPRQARGIVRAFTAYFRLVNLAERLHRIRRRRDYLRTPNKPQAGSLQAVMQQLADSGVALEQAAATLADMQLFPVFTAHPTQATRRTLLRKEQRVAAALVEQLRGGDDLLPLEQARIHEQIRREVTAGWQTEPVRSLAPTLKDETDYVTFYLINIIYRVVPVFFEQLERAVRRAWQQPEWSLSKTLAAGKRGSGAGAGDGAETPVGSWLGTLRFGSWVGGDMDGNPFVNAETLRHTLERHRALIIERYRAEVQQLFDRLSQSTSRVAIASDVVARLQHYAAQFPEHQANFPQAIADMPYRCLLWWADQRLKASLAPAIDGGAAADLAYSDAPAFMSDLTRIAESLDAHGGQHAGLFDVQRLLYRVQTFGFHLATVDIRQDAREHRRVVAELRGDPSFVDLDSAQRTKLLAQDLWTPSALASAGADGDSRSSDGDSGGNGSDNSTKESHHTLAAMMQAIAKGQQDFGPEAIGLYITSMTQGPDDALAVLWLARRFGLTTPCGHHVPLDITPLFETADDLAVAAAVMQTLFTHPVYRAHLARRGNCQTVMLGYSDSNKTAGILASRWALHEAQRQLMDVAQTHHIRLRFFHGRGGSISRGGSKPRGAILAEPPKAIDGLLRVTEQGEIIHAKYGLRDIALRTLELATGAVFESTVQPRRNGGADAQKADTADATVAPSLPPSWTRAARQLAESAQAAYRELLFDTPGFTRYFALATPIDAIERFQIGSRPPRRGAGAKSSSPTAAPADVSQLRAIPWVFAWMQSRVLLPGWYGVGAALQAVAESQGAALLADMASHWPFLDNLLADVEMALAKADMGIAQRYAALAGEEGQPIWARIRAEYERTVHHVCRIRGSSDLLERDPVLKHAIALRNPYVDPMSHIQVDCLRRWRAKERRDAQLEHTLTLTLQGIAQGLQNTG